MLDVMKRPPPVIEQITWKAARVEMPDDSITVLIYHPDDEDDPVWMGWYDSATDTWLSQEGAPLGMVTWWAHKPAGPTEPKPGDDAGDWLLVNKICNTSVEAGDAGHFMACGKPATKSVAVGLQVCFYCEDHAMAARRFVEQQGQDSIKALQRLQPGR